VERARRHNQPLVVSRLAALAAGGVGAAPPPPAGGGVDLAAALCALRAQVLRPGFEPTLPRELQEGGGDEAGAAAAGAAGDEGATPAAAAAAGAAGGAPAARASGGGRGRPAAVFPEEALPALLRLLAATTDRAADKVALAFTAEHPSVPKVTALKKIKEIAAWQGGAVKRWVVGPQGGGGGSAEPAAGAAAGGSGSAAAPTPVPFRMASVLKAAAAPADVIDLVDAMDVDE